MQLALFDTLVAAVDRDAVELMLGEVRIGLAGDVYAEHRCSSKTEGVRSRVEAADGQGQESGESCLANDVPLHYCGPF
jgi:hypothetical protein